MTTSLFHLFFIYSIGGGFMTGSLVHFYDNLVYHSNDDIRRLVRILNNDIFHGSRLCDYLRPGFYNNSDYF